MSCESVRTRILDLALDERPVDAALRAHLDSCVGCRNDLAARKAFLASIDRVLIDELREEPSPLLAARVRQAIASVEARPRAGWRGAAWTGWVPAALTVALAVIVGLAVRERLTSSVETVPIGSVPSVASQRVEPMPPSSGALVSGTGAVPERGGRAIDDAGGRLSVRPVVSGRIRSDHARPRALRIETASRTPAPARGFPEVVVPEGEMIAALRLRAASAAHPRLVREPEDDEAAKRHGEPLSIEKIEIAPLVLTPLEVGAPRPTTPSAS